MACNGIELGTLRVINNTFIGNQSEDGALFIGMPTQEVYGNVFGWNEGFGLWYTSIDPTCNCNAYWKNRSDSQGQQWFGACFYPRGGSLVIDPEFCGRRRGDYTIAKTSPLLPENYPPGFLEAGCQGVLGALGVGCDESPTIGSSWGALKRRFVK